MFLKLNIRKCIEYILILQIILLSGTLYFNSTVLLGLLGITTIFYLMTSQSKWELNKSNIYILLGLLILLFVQYGLTNENGVSFKNIMIIAITIILLFFIQNNMEYEEFCNRYLSIIFLVSIISLFCFMAINILNLNSLPLQKTVYSGISEYKVTPYYNLGIEQYNTLDGYTINNELGFKRNSGIFWEPGAYQAFLNIALLILSNKYIKANQMKKPKLFSKADLSKVIVIFLTLITTQSTTGYMIGIAIAIYTLLMNRGGMSKKNIFRLLIFLFIFLVIVLLSPIQEVIIDKTIHQEGSYSTRWNDNVASFFIFLEKPFWGYGYFSLVHTLREAQYGLYHNSSGLGLLFSMFGGVFGVLYTVFLFRGLKRFFNIRIISTIFIFIVFMLFHSTEWFIFKPLFLVFLFNFKNSANSQNGNSIKVIEEYRT